VQTNVVATLFVSTYKQIVAQRRMRLKVKMLSLKEGIRAYIHF